jgi:hypothetical protein
MGRASDTEENQRVLRFRGKVLEIPELTLKQMIAQRV